MILYLGGAYQGKCQAVAKAFQLTEKDFYRCREAERPFVPAERCLCGLHLWALGAAEREEDFATLLSLLLPEMKGKILLCDDITGGIVPMDPMERRWREELGRGVQLLAAESDEVWQVFAGLSIRLK